ncbi:hypothetical protein P0136_02920 [Lentisphaerota bacterium ZTH]|nr:hypothetical protein JYG24_05940 [Lentisphaerota bacterium]WET06954.1 hypothetical protein P0136_02920 [Lentisphaerota bacterium ZTH]
MLKLFFKRIIFGFAIIASFAVSAEFEKCAKCKRTLEPGEKFFNVEKEAIDYNFGDLYFLSLNPAFDNPNHKFVSNKFKDIDIKALYENPVSADYVQFMAANDDFNEALNITKDWSVISGFSRLDTSPQELLVKIYDGNHFIRDDLKEFSGSLIHEGKQPEHKVVGPDGIGIKEVCKDCMFHKIPYAGEENNCFFKHPNGSNRTKVPLNIMLSAQFSEVVRDSDFIFLIHSFDVNNSVIPFIHDYLRMNVNEKVGLVLEFFNNKYVDYNSKAFSINLKQFLKKEPCSVLDPYSMDLLCFTGARCPNVISCSLYNVPKLNRIKYQGCFQNLGQIEGIGQLNGYALDLLLYGEAVKNKIINFYDLLKNEMNSQKTPIIVIIGLPKDIENKQAWFEKLDELIMSVSNRFYDKYSNPARVATIAACPGPVSELLQKGQNLNFMESPFEHSFNYLLRFMVPRSNDFIYQNPKDLFGFRYNLLKQKYKWIKW